MKEKKQIFFSISLSMFLVACGGSSEQAGKNNSNTSISSSSDESLKKELITPEKNAFNEYKKFHNNLSEISLGISKDGYSGKHVNYSKNFRKVDIQVDNSPKIELKGKILTNIKNSRVCLDTNENNFCDSNEPLTLTDENAQFILKINEDLKGKHNLIALRGLDNETYRNSISILRAKNPTDSLENIVLSPYSTLLTIENIDKTKLDSIITNTNNDLESYKNSMLLQKTLDIATSSYNKQEDKEILVKSLDVYKLFATNLDTNIATTFENINDEKVKKTSLSIKNLIEKVENISLSENTKESFAVILDSKLNEAKAHFRKSDENLTLNLDTLQSDKLKDEAVKIRLKDIGVENVTLSMVNAAKDLTIKDLENISKIENISELSALKAILEKKQKATSNLVILKALLNGKTLEIYFSENISDSSKEKLKNINNIEKIYTINGLNYTIESSSWDDISFKNSIVFTETPEFREEEKSLYINYLGIEDTYGKLTRQKPVFSLIESPKNIPNSGQKKVWSKYDDGSLSYGYDLKYEKSTALAGSEIWENEKANLMWQDSPYEDGKNENITQAQAVKYCENLSYAGYEDWKLPNVKELVSTTSVNLQKKPLFDNYSSSGVSLSGSDQSAFLGERVVGVDKYGKVATVIHKDEKYSARCVRTINKKEGSLFPDNAFDNIVMYKKDKLSYDPSTGIMYQDEPVTKEEQKARDNAFKVAQKDIKSVGKFGTFEHAVQYCNKLNDGEGYENLKGWRLANVNEMFYSLNSKGSRTFQNRIDGFDYNLTSTSSYKDGMRYSWMVGNHFARVLVHNRSAGFFRCVRDMDKSELKEAKEKNAPKIKAKERRFKLDSNKEVSITLPKNIFDKYEGIRLAKHSASTLLDEKEYEISELISRDEQIENYTIKSVSLDGKELCNTNTSYDEINGQFPSTQCDEKGLFRIYVNRDLALNRYGDSILEDGKTYKIILNNRVNDFIVNLAISEDSIFNDSEDDTGSNNGDDSNTTSDIKLSEIAKTIEISASSGNRIQNNTRHILSSGEDYPDAPKFIEKEDNGKIKELKIISGNDDEVFEVYQEQGNMYWQVRVKDDKISTLETNKEYTLNLQVIDGFDKKTNTIEVKIKVITPAIKAKDAEVSISDAEVKYGVGSKLKGTNEPILYLLDMFNSPYDKNKIHVIESANAKEEEIKYELEENDTFKLLRFNIEYGNYYAIVLKDGKTPKEKEELKLKAIISYVEGGVTKTQESAFTVTITNSENKSYSDIQALTKTDGTNGSELEVLIEEPDVISEKFPAVLKDYIYDDSEYKIYPSNPNYSFVIVPLNKIIEKEATTEGNDTVFEIVSGNDKGYFKTEVYGTSLKIQLNDNKVPETGTYNLGIKRTQSQKSSNTANITFTVSEIKAPSVIEETVKLNLTDKNTKNDSYYAEESATTKVTPLFIFDFSKNKYNPEKFGILKRDEEGNNLLNGSKNLKYKLISDNSNSYEVKEFYKKKWGDPEKQYGIFLKEGKNGNITANLEIQMIGEFNGIEYPNETPANVDIEFKVDEFTLKSEVLSIKKSNMKEYWKDNHKYFSLVTKEPYSSAANSSVFPFNDIGSYENTDSLKFEIDGTSDNYIIKKVGEYWELQLKEGVSEAKTETLIIKVTGVLDTSHTGTFELQITE